MRNIIEIDCPPELLIGLHANAEQFAERIKREAAIGLFRDGVISSGIAASWLGVPRAVFLIDAMRRGATLLEDSEDDFRRESAPL
jgi:predicted HTH domain antitoxin